MKIVKIRKFDRDVISSKYTNYYHVSYECGRQRPWRCTCPHNQFRHRNCRHIDLVKDEKLALEKQK